ncbi:glycosyltransferase [Pelistega sp. MC2]|uniref:glycosyltransferase n=1 Tax=Pelistega sp. MC2 TaxID=1720297 RepID=UPI00210D86C3|nr:glycosyltransferase [Pelistega sp. MC2]
MGSIVQRGDGMTLRVIHLISGLGQGGAETVLSRLVTHSSVENIVVSFSDEGVFGEVLRQAGVAVYTIGMQSGKVGLGDFWKLVKLLKQLRGDVIQTWMYHGDFFGGIAARVAGYKHIAWGIRNSGDSLKNTSKMNYYLARISAFFSRFIPEKIIVCGEKAALIHASWGYQKSKMHVIQNGYDFSKWQINVAAAQALRESWHISEQIPVLGFVARWNPLKDHKGLLIAFQEIKKSHPDAVLVLVGKGLDRDNAELMQLLAELSLMVDKDVLLLGLRADIPEIMSAIDIHVLSSIAEGFPNVVSESMACLSPNVVTDVGDAALIVDQYGWVAQPANPKDLAEKMNQALDLLAKPHQSKEQAEHWLAFAQQGRQRVLESFSLQTMVSHYESIWHAMAKR